MPWSGFLCSVGLVFCCYYRNYSMKKKLISATILAAFLSTVFAGCSSMGVDPWDRDLLARPDMSMESASIETAFDDKMYYSREASSGGKGFAGGGCGCN